MQPGIFRCYRARHGRQFGLREDMTFPVSPSLLLSHLTHSRLPLNTLLPVKISPWRRNRNPSSIQAHQLEADLILSIKHSRRDAACSHEFSPVLELRTSKNRNLVLTGVSVTEIIELHWDRLLVHHPATRSVPAEYAVTLNRCVLCGSGLKWTVLSW